MQSTRVVNPRQCLTVIYLSLPCLSEHLCSSCGMVANGCREPDTKQGPATVRTPYGLGVKEWEQGLQAYAKQAEKLAGVETK